MITDKISQKQDYERELRPDYSGKTLNIEITTRCNEKCIYCYHEVKGTHGNLKNIDEELFYRVTKEAYELGITDVGLYMAGEPLMNPKVYDYVKYLKGLGFRYVYISTNGLLCTPENLEKLAEAGIDSVKFSLAAATKDNFIKHHGVDGFELVKNNLKYAFEYRGKSQKKYGLYAFCILTKFNIEEKELMEQEYGPYVDEIVFTNVLDHMVPIKGFQEYLMFDEDVANQKPRRPLPCPLAFNTVAVDEEGFLHICCSSNRDSTKIADLRKMSLKEGLYSEEYVALRKRLIQGEIAGTYCEVCCKGGENINQVNNLIELESGSVEIIPHLDATDEIRRRFIEK
ncbi:MAG: radical SAM protein [Lachnospiraceae bacterium]|nr:radical SAM protein [Lachnospiraceae bacterium]